MPLIGARDIAAGGPFDRKLAIVKSVDDHLRDGQLAGTERRVAEGIFDLPHVADFQSFAAAYDTLLCSDPSMPAGCPADLNADSNVDDADFSLFAAAYNELYCP